MKKEPDEEKKNGAKKRAPHPRRPASKFQWGEVDDVSQEDMLLPAKKKKGGRRKPDRIESTLTVGGEETDPYAIKPKSPRPETSRDPAIPSYGKMMAEEDDEFDVFLRNAERAEQRERERERAKELARKKPQSAPKPKKAAASPDAPPAETGPAKPEKRAKTVKTKKDPRGEQRQPSQPSQPSQPRPAAPAAADGEVRKVSKPEPPQENPLAAILSRFEQIRGYGLGELEKREHPEKTKKLFLSCLAGTKQMLELLDKLVHFPIPPKEVPAKPKPKRLAEPVPKEGEAEKLASLRSRWTFGGASLSKPMLEMLAEVHYETPTPIQSGTIPLILAGKDLMAQSRTGSGKTAAFMIPIIEQIESCEPGDDPVALIVAPTRELAVQIRDETARLAHNREIAVVACYGGKPIADQIKKMKGGVDIVIGTPGRILDLAKRSALRLSSLRWVVLDEADRMLDIGFRPDIERILRQTPRDRQTLLFSATLADEVVRLAQRYMTEPETCDFSENEIASETIEQFYITVDRNRKYEALMHLLRRENPQQAIVFCRTKRGVEKLGANLVREFKDWAVSSIHGDLPQSVRDSIMRSFRAGKIKILVATDVVGRGIDVSGISHIINYDIPQYCDDYVHRVGRTGRMGREGVAFTLVTSEEGNELTRIEMRINRLLKRTELEGFEAFTRPDAADKEEPKEPKPVFGKPLRRVRRAL